MEENLNQGIYYAAVAELAAQGWGLGRAFMDEASPLRGSPIEALEARRALIPPGSWPREDVALLTETLRALVGVAGVQLHGVAANLRSGPPVYLHPLVTLVRGIAEACGQIWWCVEPWVNDAGGDLPWHPVVTYLGTPKNGVLARSRYLPELNLSNWMLLLGGDDVAKRPMVTQVQSTKRLRRPLIGTSRFSAHVTGLRIHS